ncbi:MAG: germination protein YpeB [Clostridia bacterium]|nr:germination protein YpeB [Clostridia bacterium]
MKRRTVVAFIIALVITCGVLAVGWVGSNAQMMGYAGRLESTYQKSFSELVTNINSIEIYLSKALITVDSSKKQELYQKVNQQCSLCATNLSNLPVNHESIVETTRFVNQLGGFSYYLSQKLKNSGAMSDEDTSSINELYNWCVYVQSVINDFANSENVGFNILSSTSMGNTTSKFDTLFVSTMATGTEFPTLIYDGPFSDSIKNKEIKGLGDFEITVDEAKDVIRQAFDEYNIKNLRFVGKVSGRFEAYNFSFETAHRNYYVDITKKGGLLLSASSSGNLAVDVLSLNDAELEAENFAHKNGFDEMKSVWSTVLNGVAYVNLVPVLNNVMIYPDMIKAKVSLDTGSIIGWEALSYAYNHDSRDDFDFLVSETDARKMVSPELNILSIKKCIVPQEYGVEELCYEYKCTYNNYTYYVYISGKTGIEVQTLRVIKTSSGNLLQ